MKQKSTTQSEFEEATIVTQNYSDALTGLNTWSSKLIKKKIILLKMSC